MTVVNGLTRGVALGMRFAQAQVFRLGVVDIFQVWLRHTACAYYFKNRSN